MSDHPVPLPLSEREIDDAVDSALDHGERTLPLARNQMFSFDSPTIAVATEDTSTDPIIRIERKVDSALRMIAVLQKKVDSIDAVLAKVIHRLT